MRDRIRLKNANDLLVDSGLDGILKSDGDRTERFATWRGQQIGFLLLLADEDRHDVLTFVEAARDAGFIVRTFRPEANFAALERLRADVLREVRRSPGLILGNGSRPLSLETFLALLLLTLKRNTSPEKAVLFAAGREDYREQDRLVYEYKQYLDPSYRLPEQVRPDVQATAPVEAPEPQQAPAAAPDPAANDFERPSADLIVESQTKWDDESAQADGNAASTQTPAAQTDDDLAASLAPPELLADNDPGHAPRQTATEHDSPTPAPSVTEPSPVAAPAMAAGEEAPAPGQAPAATAPPAAALSGGPAPGQDSFHASKFTIRVKLIAITSGIIIGALGTMIFLASYFFRSAMESNVQENNLNQATVIGSRVETELRALETGARLLVTGGGGGALRDEFFASNPGILFVGTAGRDGNGLVLRRSIYNRAKMDENELKESDIQRLHELNGKDFLPSFNGAKVFRNISPGFIIPVLGFSRSRIPGEEILLVYIDAGNFLEVFTGGGDEKPEQKITQTFMVSSKGEVIAHPDPARVLSRSDLSDLVIVQELLKSAVKEGQKAYEDKDGKSYLGSYKKIDFAGLGIVSTAEEERVLAPVYWIQRSNLYITGIVLALAILIVYYVARSLSVPIVRLVGATKAVERGDYSVNIAPASRDEVGVLTDSFVRMAQGLGEREKLKDAMVKFVNKQVADLALKGEIKLGGEQKNNVAVFFSDLRGFTAMSEKMTAEEVVSYLNEYFTGMVSCVNQTNGIVDKFIGDAVMAHWGAFESHGNDTENAVNGALMMRTAIMEFNKRGEGKRPFAKQGCGINTGPLVSGQIGSEERFEFTVIGDTVNLASRIEALNKPFGTDILISQDSYDLVKDIFKVEAMPAIKVKGKAEPQTIYAVVGRLDDPDCPADMNAVRKLLGIEFDSNQQIDPDAKEEKFEVVGG